MLASSAAPQAPACASTLSAVARGLAEQRAGDHEPLDLARALVDLGDLGVAVVALGRELLGVAVAAEHLDRLAGPAARDARRRRAWPARPRPCAGGRPASAGRRARSARAPPRSRSACRRASAGSAWKPPIGAAERRALLRVGDREVERRLRDADRLRGDADAPAVERRQRDPHAGAAARRAARPGVSSKPRSAVVEEFRPSFSSSRVTRKPAAPRRTTNALGRSARPGRGRRRGTMWACEPLVIHCLVPVSAPSLVGARAHRARVASPSRTRSARTRASSWPCASGGTSRSICSSRAVGEDRQRARRSCARRPSRRPPRRRARAPRARGRR